MKKKKRPIFRRLMFLLVVLLSIVYVFGQADGLPRQRRIRVPSEALIRQRQTELGFMGNSLLQMAENMPDRLQQCLQRAQDAQQLIHRPAESTQVTE